MINRPSGLGVLLVLVVLVGTCHAADVSSSASFIDDLKPAGVNPPLVVVKTKDDTSWREALIGMDLQEGDRVWVKEGATATVKIGGVAVVYLEPDSVFTIPTSDENRSTVSRVQLEKGGLWACVRRLLSGESFSVETVNALGGVKGTQFRLTHQDEGDTDWNLLEGELLLQGVGGDPSPVVLKPGHFFGFRRGGHRKTKTPQVLRFLARRTLVSGFKQRFRMDLPGPGAIPQMLRTTPRRIDWHRSQIDRRQRSKYGSRSWRGTGKSGAERIGVGRAGVDRSGVYKGGADGNTSGNVQGVRPILSPILRESLKGLSLPERSGHNEVGPQGSSPTWQQKLRREKRPGIVPKFKW